MNTTARTRLRPRLWDRRRHPLTQLRKAVETRVTGGMCLGPGQTVVDIGCGSEPYRSLFEDVGCRYIGCDIDGDVDVRITPGVTIPLGSGTADAVTSFQVLEHVWELAWYLGECRRLLRPGGSLLLSTHGTWLFHPHPGDYRRWTRDGLSRELADHGLEVYDIQGLVGPLAWTTQFRTDLYSRAISRVPGIGAPLASVLSTFMNLRMMIEDALTPEQSRQRNASIYIALARPT